MAEKPTGAARPPRWPTLEHQFVASRVIHGSALEALIIANQDFSMLRPEEAHDNLRLPPWLRVYWRKKNPEGRYFGPSGGYPLVLRELYEWMMDNQDLPVQKGPGEGPNPPGRPNEKGGRHGD